MGLFGKKSSDRITGMAQSVSKKEIDAFRARGVADILPGELFDERLQKGERQRIYLGVDPTGPAIHIGHAVILRALRQLQDWGHEIILLIGDFTARIGDPTGKDAARVVMTHEDILANAASYQEQASKILDFDGENAARIDYNAKWLDALKFQDVMELSAHFTVQQMLERDMFQNRIADEKPIYVHEFFYPMMQGYDSVAMDVDGEAGGTDQLFNMLTGRTLLKEMKGKEKFVMTFELLEGLDGRKMSKSYDNIIGVTDAPVDMYGKAMSVADELIVKYFRLCTDLSLEEVDAVAVELEGGAHPRDIKMRLAHMLVTQYHDAAAADAAQQEFVRVFQEKAAPTEMDEHTVSAAELNIVDLVAEVGFAQSKGEARRLVQQGGVRVNDEVVNDIETIVTIAGGEILQVGKRRFARLRV